jgi:hypothetical protein
MVIAQHFGDMAGLERHTDTNRNGCPTVSLALWAVHDPLIVVAPRNLRVM